MRIDEFRQNKAKPPCLSEGKGVRRPTNLCYHKKQLHKKDNSVILARFVEKEKEWEC